MTVLAQALYGQRPFPTRVDAGGESFPIITDFRYWLSVEHAFSNPACSPLARWVLLLGAVVPGQGVPENAVPALTDFFLAGAKPTGANTLRLVDFEKDALFIYAGFMQDYAMDLATVSLHWWAFLALFWGLSEGTAMKKLITQRANGFQDLVPPARDLGVWAEGIKQRKEVVAHGRRDALR